MTNDDKINELTDLRALEVSLVDKGANEKKRFPITKQEQDMELDKEILEAVLKTEVDEEADLFEYLEKAKLSPKGVNAVKAALRLLNAYKDEMPSDVLAKLADVAGYSAPKEAKKQKESTPKKKMEPEEEEMKEKEVKKELTPEAEEILKAQKTELEDLKKRNEEVTKALQVEKDKRELDDWVRKAEADLAFYPGKNAQELGESLKKMADFDPEVAKTQFEAMKAASDALKESNVLKEAGEFGKSTEGSAWSKIQKMAEGLVEKSADAAFTKEKAVALVCERQPELYTQYLLENPAMGWTE